MKPTYDVFANARGIRNWSHGTFEELHRSVYGSKKPFPADEYEIIDTPSCFLRVKKSNLKTDAYIAHIRSHFAIYRINPAPRYPHVVQWSTKPGKWINDRAFDSPEEAREYVEQMNARLIPYSNSQYLIPEVSDEH